MKLRTLLGMVALVGTTTFVTSEVVSQERNAAPDPRPKEARGAGADNEGKAGADGEAMIDTWVQHAMPGEHHRLLRRMAGSWNLAVKYRMNAEAPIVESHGACERKWILGNRFLLEEFDGGNLALPFQGLAIYGYDAFEKKYTSVWVDTMSTAITTNLGVCRKSCELIHFTGQHGDPWSGTKRTSRGVTRFVNDDRHVLELYEPDADGKEFKILEIVYTRK